MNKKRFLLLPLVIIGSVVQAQDIATALGDCSKEKNSLKRLVCFDRVVKDLNQYQLKQVTPQPSVPAQATVTVAPTNSVTAEHDAAQNQVMPEPEAQADFGFEHKKAVELSDDKLYAQVSAIEKDPYKNLIITLANEQVWKQTEAKYFKVKANDSVFVERGVLGSFFLGMDNTNQRIRVKRIK